MWLLLTYKVSSEPTSRRVYIWRKLKRLGAILLHDAAWVLPANERTREQLQWLLAEIHEMEGTATLWEATQAFNGQNELLVQQFIIQVDQGYQAILNDLRKDDSDLTALSRRYQQTHLQDYFESSLGKEVRAALLSLQGGGQRPHS